ncbi:hypothetical protein [Sphingomonas sanguinis]|nr:hypothetical protein [Sphingomonas sanguinis]
MNLFRYRARQARRVAVCTAALGIVAFSSAADAQVPASLEPRNWPTAKADMDEVAVMPHQQFYRRWRECRAPLARNIILNGQDDLTALRVSRAACEEYRVDFRSSLARVIPLPRVDKVLQLYDLLFSENLASLLMETRIKALSDAGNSKEANWQLFPIRKAYCGAGFEAPDKNLFLSVIKRDGTGWLVASGPDVERLATNGPNGVLSASMPDGTTYEGIPAERSVDNGVVKWTAKSTADRVSAILGAQTLTLRTPQASVRLTPTPIPARILAGFQSCPTPPGMQP